MKINIRVSVSLLAAALILNFLLSSCSELAQPEHAGLPDNLSQPISLSFVSQNFKPTTETKFSWLGEPTMYIGDDVSIRRERTPYIMKSLLKELAHKNYQFSHSSATSEYLAQAVIIIGNDLHNDELFMKLKFNPQLGDEHITYERGSLVLFIINRSSGELAWRGVVQMFADPSQNLSLAKSRIEKSVSELTATLPLID